MQLQFGVQLSAHFSQCKKGWAKLPGPRTPTKIACLSRVREVAALVLKGSSALQPHSERTWVPQRE